MIITNRDLVEHLKNSGVMHSGNLVEALENIDRADFVGEANRQFAYLDNALPIGNDQTISQPLTVVFMLELLNVAKGDLVMEIGSGSAWQTCLISHMIGEKGYVYAIELLPGLFNFGIENAKKYPEVYKKIQFFNQNGISGLADIADGISGFDKIICSAELKEKPVTWFEQLKIGGVTVYPMDNGIFKITKTSEDKYEEEFYPGFVFVPFVYN